jgi:hypothetical protein
VYTSLSIPDELAARLDDEVLRAQQAHERAPLQGAVARPDRRKATSDELLEAQALAAKGGVKAANAWLAKVTEVPRAQRPRGRRPGSEPGAYPSRSSVLAQLLREALDARERLAHQGKTK